VGRTVSEYLKCRETNITPTAHHHAALRGESVHFEYKRHDRVLERINDRLGHLAGNKALRRLAKMIP
jgi:GGDEF domain-containing protein